MRKALSVLLAMLMAFSLAACGDGETEKPHETSEATIGTHETTVETTEPNELEVVEKFINLYNASAENLVSDLSEMDIQGDDYKTEFRLAAYEDAVGLKGTMTGGTIEVVNYGRRGDCIRIYAYVESYDAAVALVYNVIRVLDSTITDDEIAGDLGSSILLGEKNCISGYMNPDYANGGIAGFDIMIDCNNLDFMS